MTNMSYMYVVCICNPYFLQQDILGLSLKFEWSHVALHYFGTKFLSR